MDEVDTGSFEAAECQFAAAAFQIVECDNGAIRPISCHHAGEVGADEAGASGNGDAFLHCLIGYHAGGIWHNT